VNNLEMLWLALAAQLTAPIPENLGTWFRFDDVPQYLLGRDSGFWQVGIRVNVAPDGRILSCDTEASSGIRPLDKLTCNIVLRRARFHPARWSDGSAAVGVYRTSIQWAVGNSPWDTSKAINADLDLFVSGLPRGITSPTLVRIMFAVDAGGLTSSCTAEPTEAKYINNDSALVSIACGQMTKSYKASPATDSAGKPISSVQDALVRFSLQR
jgi:hypothetical protein